MKRIGILIATLLLSCTLSMHAAKKTAKQEIIEALNVVAAPLSQLEKAVKDLQIMTDEASRSLINIDIGSKEQCKEMTEKIKVLMLEAARVQILIKSIFTLIGAPDDESVGDEAFNSVTDIDNAELTVIQWLKTIYREQLKDKFIS